MGKNKYGLENLKIWKGAHVLMLIINKEVD